ncbi:MAG: universal stress protein [Planctomycetes bacterium]|nr:universal stress protein [Planctomycetota bacterium]
MADKKILYATDYSESSQHALCFAESLARDWGAALLIVHVSDRELQPVGELVDEEPKPNPEELARLQKVRPGGNVPFEHRLLYAPPTSETVHPSAEILRLAKEEHVDAIVMGTHGRTGLMRALAGSVAEAVSRNAACPVVTVRKAKEES